MLALSLWLRPRRFNRQTLGVTVSVSQQHLARITAAVALVAVMMEHYAIKATKVASSLVVEWCSAMRIVAVMSQETR